MGISYTSAQAQEIELAKLRLSQWSQKLPKVEPWDKFVKSIRAQGVRVPIVVFKNGEGYSIFDGRNRFEAATEAGLEKIPARILTGAWCTKVTDEEKEEFFKALNEHRRHLKWSEKAKAYAAEVEKKGRPKNKCAESAHLSKTTENIAQEAGFSSARRAQEAAALAQATVPEVHAAIDNEEITQTQAKQIAQLPKEEQPNALEKAAAGEPIPTKPRPAKPIDRGVYYREARTLVGKAIKIVDKATKDTKHYKACRDSLNAFLNAWEAWKINK